MPIDQPAPAPSAQLTPETIAEVSALFEDAVSSLRTAGVAWAVVGGHADDQLLLAEGAAGHQHLEDGSPAQGSAPMSPATISRIASMTKSFTAASVLRLRDEGAVRLDDPITAYVPEAAGITPATPDSPAITVRDLLTMSAGLVTDNPWGDRQESMTREAFRAMLEEGLEHVHTPGTGFEYSNTGYALLGRLVDEVSGHGYDEYISSAFLEPLGLADSAFTAEVLPAERLATGHRVGDREDATKFEPIELDRPGVYGAMAGIFSTVADVARWVRFLAAADAPDAAHRPQELLSTASRREMQQMHRVQRTAPLPPADGGASPGFDRVRAYGFGLVVERFADLGEVISHSGGYPGFGSFMVWHRDSGIGVVVLANSKYAPASVLGMQALRVILSRQPDLLAARRTAAAPRTLEAATAALGWLTTGDAQIAETWFADNMDLDSTREERLRRRDAALAASGLDLEAITALHAEDAEVLSRAAVRWVIPGTVEGMRLRIDLEMDPRRRALIQGLDVRAEAVPS